MSKIDIPIDNNIVEIPIEEAMPENYLPYAVEVAKDRALPDVRDGLKPVHRRIVYGAYMLKAFPDKPYYKSARIVGDILGKYHPHGDTSVYDAMTILAQDFTTRMPIIDGHGNWGSIDGDSAAAMRYTEARLTKTALLLIKDIEKDVVDMMENYSGSELEPTVLPARYPNILVNGAFGIAVGLSTNIPPHNLGEVIDATVAFINNPNITVKELLSHIKGPDLPTGGIVIGENALQSAYEKGEGKVTLRAKAIIEKLENGRLGIVISEFPYRKNKSRILQNISEMTADKRHSKVLEPISDIRDESDRTGIRAVIEFKKSCDEQTADKILKYLYKRTELQTNLSFNMVALADGKPQTLNLSDILYHYVNHQKEVVRRRTKKELQIAERRFHIIEGFIRAIDIIDEIIATIRQSKSKKDSQNNLVSKFGFTEVQAEAILELMLYRLTGLEIKAFEKEHRQLEKEIKRLKKILDSESELLKVIKNELLEIKDQYTDKRRTEIIKDDTEAKIDVEELIIIEDVVVTMSNEGYIKRTSLKTYNRLNGDANQIEYREGDFAKYIHQCNTKDTLVMLTNKGNMYQVKVADIPETKWKEKGEKLEEIIKGLNLDTEKIISTYVIEDFLQSKDFIFITSKGGIKKSGLDKFNTSYTKISALKLKKDEELIFSDLVNREREEKFIKIFTKLSLNFTMEEPTIDSAERNIMNTELFKLPFNDKIVSTEFTNKFEYKTFTVKIEKDSLKSLNGESSADTIKCSTNSSSNLLIFLDNGEVIKIPAYMVQNVGLKGIKLSNIYEQYVEGKTRVLNIISIENFDEEIDVFFYTKNGMVKRTPISEFNGSYLSATAYKLKNEKDVLINVNYIFNNDEKNIILITKKGMCIKFDNKNINYMGRIASGVSGISLKEEDVVIYANVIDKEDSKINIRLTSCNEETKMVNAKDIKIQNRAGRGTNLMLVVMNDYISQIEII